MTFSLIVPIAADNTAYEQQLPYVFGLNKQGIMHCINAVMGLNLDAFDSIYFTILAKHDQKYHLLDLFKLQFERLGFKNAKVTLLPDPTNCQASTIYQTIQQEKIEGSIFIKDADGYFCSEVTPANGIAVYPLEDLHFVNPQNKSYVAVDDMFYITNVIEKNVISHYFNAGGSCFEDAALYCDYYNRLQFYGDKLYISHIIYAMLLDKKIFRPIEVTDFQDFGDDKLFSYYINSL